MFHDTSKTLIYYQGFCVVDTIILLLSWQFIDHETAHILKDAVKIVLIINAYRYFSSTNKNYISRNQIEHILNTQITATYFFISIVISTDPDTLMSLVFQYTHMHVRYNLYKNSMVTYRLNEEKIKKQEQPLNVATKEESENNNTNELHMDEPTLEENMNLEVFINNLEKACLERNYRHLMFYIFAFIEQLDIDQFVKLYITFINNSEVEAKETHARLPIIKDLCFKFYKDHSELVKLLLDIPDNNDDLPDESDFSMFNYIEPIEINTLCEIEKLIDDVVNIVRNINMENCEFIICEVLNETQETYDDFITKTTYLRHFVASTSLINKTRNNAINFNRKHTIDLTLH